MESMNKKGHPTTLVAGHPGNLNAVKSGAHSARLIEARASEIVDGLGIADELDEEGKIALWELARLTAVIEAIDRDLSDRGLTDRNGKERYILQRRERYSRRLMEVSDRVLAARNRTRKQKAIDSPGDIVGEQSDYIRQLQAIALGHDPEARVSDRLLALKLLTGLGVRGTTSYFEPQPPAPLDEDDREFQAEAAMLEAELETVQKAARLQHLRDEIMFTKIRG
jgi:hypothetical protein